jgi:hypothetical protein
VELPSRSANDETLVGYWNDGEEGKGYRLGQVRTVVVGSCVPGLVVGSLPSGAVSSVDLAEVRDIEVWESFRMQKRNMISRALSFGSNSRIALREMYTERYEHLIDETEGGGE